MYTIEPIGSKLYKIKKGKSKLYLTRDGKWNKNYLSRAEWFTLEDARAKVDELLREEPYTIERIDPVWVFVAVVLVLAAAFLVGYLR
jgi:hypothetical protein